MKTKDNEQIHNILGDLPNKINPGMIQEHLKNSKKYKITNTTLNRLRKIAKPEVVDVLQRTYNSNIKFNSTPAQINRPISFFLNYFYVYSGLDSFQ